MKKLLSLFLALVATTCLWAYDFQSGELYYTITSSSEPYTVEVTYQEYWSSDNYLGLATATIPETVTYNGTTYSVTSIGEWAFMFCSSLTSVTIPNSVTSIGDEAFYSCSSLTSITIPNSVTSIGSGAFDDCSSLTSAVYNAHCFAYMPPSFEGAYTIPDGIKQISDGAFYYCKSLTSITIPNSVTSIGDYALSSCSSLTSVTIGNSVTSIGDDAFRNCSSLTSVTINSDAIVNKAYSLSSNISRIFGSQVTKYIIGDEVTGIGNYAFSDCSSLTSLTIGESVTSIGNYAFYQCRSLTSITISNSVTSIGNGAFQYCGSLSSVTIPESVTSIGERAFAGCSSLTSPVYNTHCFAYMPPSFEGAYTILDGIKQIVGAAFRNCSSLTSVTIPNSVTSIGNYAFEDCSSLTSITIPNSVTSIGERAFYDCSSLTSVTIGNSVTSIGSRAFYSCTSLTSITIPNSVTSIGDYALSSCSSLTSVTIGNSVTSIGSAAFGGCSSLTSVTINSDAIVNKEYSSSSNISRIFGSQVTKYIIGDEVTGIGNYAFYRCSSLTSITIPNSVTTIGVSAFEDCSSLTSITCEAKNPPTVYNYAFYNVSKSIPVYVPCGTVSAYNAAGGWASFYNIQEPLAEYSIKVSVNDNIMGTAKVDRNSACGNQISATPNIGYHFVQWNDGNTDNPRTLVLTQDITLTAEFAQSFSGQCGDSLYWELVDTTLQITGKGEMYDYKPDSAPWKLLVSSIKVLTIAEDVTKIGYDAFDGCTALVTIVWNAKHAADAYNDGQYSYPVFYGICSQITSFTFDKAVEHIPAYLCYGMKKLTAITIPNSVTSIGKGAFYECSSLTSITIPNSVTSIGNSAFSGCSSLSSITIGNSVTSIGEWVFDNCSSLTSVTIPESVTSIGYAAFAYCSSLASVTIPNSVTSIGNRAFGDCSGLTSITIPNSVTSIGNEAFRFCTSLTSVTCEAATPPTLGSLAFNGVSKSIPVYVPCGQVDAYKVASRWEDFTNIQDPLAEYSISLTINDSNMGTAQVDKNTACGNQISATANYGYHFVRWSDGNTDNPRSLGLTQDTVLTAEFAPNKYTITTVSSDTQRGTTQGDTIVNYLEYITISATASYGYHFVQWNGGNSVNPRQVQVTKDMTYTATFDKNTYAISLSCNEEQGRVEGVTSAEYLDTVTISANANYGYHFAQWSDGNTDNPRTLVLTQDTTLTAEFAQSFSGQCGDNLYWDYDKTNQTISITGSGDMYDYTTDTQPWLLFKDQIKEVTTSSTATSIGEFAFAGAIHLGDVYLGSNMEIIAKGAFAECSHLYHIYCYPTYPPSADQSSFANYNVYLHVPCDYKEGYDLDIVLGDFKYIECMGAESEPINPDTVIVIPGTNDVTITWPTEENADTYTIVIMKGDVIFCRLIFNKDGQLLNIAFAPSRDGKNHPAQYAAQTANGLRFTVTGLEEKTKYGYDVSAQDEEDNTLSSYTGEFTTMGGTAVEDILQNTTNIQKILRNGQLIILRDGKTYTTMGAEIQ